MHFRFCWLITLFMGCYVHVCSQDVNALLEEHELMGISVMAMCGGEVAWTGHAGLSDFQENLTIDDNTYFRIASVSKMVTATGAMYLAQEGLLDLDEDVSTYLGYELRNPNYPDTPLTMTMLLSHRAGIQDGDGYSNLIGGTFAAGNSSVPNINEVLFPDGDYYTNNIWRQELPGTYFAYSNLNFAVVATVIEAVSQQRFDVFMKDAVFEPLGITGSFNVADITPIENLARLYRWQGGQWVVQVDGFTSPPEPFPFDDYVPGTNGLYFAPQGGFRANMLDLEKVVRLHLGQYPQVLTQESLDLMHTPLYTYDGTNGDNYFGLFRSWGYGIQNSTSTINGDIIIDGYDWWGHPGEAYGLISDLYFDKATGNAIVFLTNGAKNGFDFGNQSAFYTLEEDVFEMIETYFEAGCPVSVEESSETPFLLTYSSSEQRITIHNEEQFIGARVEICDSLGKLIYQGILDSGTMDLKPRLSPGTYYITLSTTVNQWSKQFVHH